MVMRYLLDTNTISEPLRPAPNPQVVARLSDVYDTVAIAAVTWHELLFGLYRLPPSRKRDAIDDYLFTHLKPMMPILAYDYVAAQWFAQERARLAAIGRSPSYPDSQIAATAFANNLILVTRNVSDFAAFQGIRVENWFVA